MADCRCSNITIMQLFHQLKQRFPTVPDHVVSKVIQQNCHDKTACETILQQESHNYMQCYPGALISCEGRLTGPLGPLSDRCSLGPGPPRRSFPGAEADINAVPTSIIAVCTLQDNALKTKSTQSTLDEDDHQTTPPRELITPLASKPNPPTLEEKVKLSKIPLGQLVQEAQERLNERSPNESPDDDRSICSPQSESPIVPPPYANPPNGDNVAPECSVHQVPVIQSQKPTESTSPGPSSISKNSCSSSPSKQNDLSANLNPRPPVRPTPLSSEPTESLPSRPTLSNGQSSISKNSRSRSPLKQNDLSSNLNPRPPVRPTTLSCDPLRTKSSGGRSPNRLLPAHSPGSPSRPAPSHNSEAVYGCASHSRDSPSQDSTCSSQEYKVAVECVVSPSRPGDRPGAFTSVNLTLRPPSTDPSVPIDIRSGQSVTYTTAKFDPTQGYQSHLQIRISPTGGTVTACRMRVTPPSLRAGSRSPCRAGALCHSRPHVRALLLKQRERKDVLARELRQKQDMLCAMRIQVRSLQTALARHKPNPLVVNKLKADRDRLRAECERLTAAVDRYLDPPSGDADQNFYSNLYTGQRQQRGGWSCRLCTFQNHELMTQCEQCEMPRLLGTMSNPVRSNNNSFFLVGETSGSVSRTIAPLQER